jgi:predicted dehydrogenase
LIVRAETGHLGVAVVGLGVGEQHARAFAAHPSCSVRWLYDLSAVQAQALSATLPGSSVARSFEEILEHPDVDVVSIASYDDDHFSQVVRALRAGKHVFVEKPLCRTMAELLEVKASWLAGGGRLKLRSNLVLRAAPLYLGLRARIAEGHFGTLYAFDGDYLYGRLHKITEGWRRDVLDYSVIEGGGIHLIDLLLWLTGERPVSVSAVGNRICTEGTGFRYDDFAAATLEFDSGLIGRITANFGCVHRHQHVLRVFGTSATFLYDDAGPRLHRSRDPDRGPEHVPEDPLPAHKGDLIPDFVRAVLENADDHVETTSVFDGICVCVATDDALRTGMRKAIEYV